MSALLPIATAKADIPQMVMSALPPKADMCSAKHHFCFGPETDICTLFDHLVGIEPVQNGVDGEAIR
jgi:hypothetical protein